MLTSKRVVQETGEIKNEYFKFNKKIYIIDKGMDKNLNKLVLKTVTINK